MIHLLLLVGILGLAYGIRLQWVPQEIPWRERWLSSLTFFLLPPLLIFTTMVSIVCMGTQGSMAGWWSGKVSYGAALVFLSWCCWIGGRACWQNWYLIQTVQRYPKGIPGRLLESDIPFAAQVGFWDPELVISSGLMNQLSPAHLTAVLAHEEAHRHFRDPFWFFWLGWIRQATEWMPNTDLLWQELLLLRELRADQWAAQRVDPLLLAESLLLVVSQWPKTVEHWGVALSPNRLEMRIESLLGSDDFDGMTTKVSSLWIRLTPAFLPLMIIPFHG
jgi:Zn-dependent protease with chaperone function